jgi:hypothetical protein
MLFVTHISIRTSNEMLGLTVHFSMQHTLSEDIPHLERSHYHFNLNEIHRLSQTILYSRTVLKFLVSVI